MLPIFISEAVRIPTILKILGTKVLLAAVTGFLLDLILRRFRKQEVHKDIHDLCEHEHCHCEDGIWKSALRHTLQITLFLFLITLALGLCIQFLGEDTISGFLTGQPVPGVFLAALVGLIPQLRFLGDHHTALSVRPAGRRPDDGGTPGELRRWPAGAVPHQPETERKPENYGRPLRDRRTMGASH